MAANKDSATKPQERTTALFIRPLRQEDWLEVCRIEKLAYPIPWSDKIHQDCIDSKYPSILLESQSEVLGYAIFNYLVDECHLLNIAINPKFQGKGFATKLLNGILLRASESDMVKVILEVRASNQAAINFYQKEQFMQIGCRKKYYKTIDGYEDAIVMEKLLD